MTNARLLGSWVRRFLLEHVVDERNLSINTQRSYRDQWHFLKENALFNQWDSGVLMSTTGVLPTAPDALR